MTLTILAVDPATVTGWACSDGTSGAVDFGELTPGRTKRVKLAEPERHGFIGCRFDRWLDAKLNLTQAGALLVERQMTHQRAHLLVGLRMLALVAGWRRGLLVEEVWSSQWRPLATARGVWTKGDEADAQAMLSWWVETRLPRLEEEPSVLRA